MRKIRTGAVAVAAGIALAGAAAPAEAKRYYIGEGESARKSGLKFVVNEGKVRDLVTAVATRCSDGRVVHLGVGFDDLKLERSRFAVKDIATNDRHEASGKVRGDRASGSFNLTFRSRDHICRPGPVKWQAEQVSREEYQETTVGDLTE